MSDRTSLSARLEVIELALEELLAGQLMALPPERAAALAGGLQTRAGYASADPGYDPAECHAHEVALAMDRLLRAASRRAEEAAAARTPGLRVQMMRGDRLVRQTVGVLD